MNQQTGSTLQKVNFALLVLIAAALGYLIARHHLDARRAPIDSPEPTSSAMDESRRPPVASSSTKPSYAPLRPRVETNAFRPTPVRASPSPIPPAARPPERIFTAALGDVAMHAPDVAALPVPVAFTSGSGETPAETQIRGRVILHGRPPPEKPVVLDRICGRLHPQPMTTRHYVVAEDGGLANVFVYIKSGVAPQKTPQPSLPLLDNVNCEFQPYVLGVRTGQPFAIRNSDPVLHNVHARAKNSGNAEFNTGLPIKGSAAQRAFRTPEVFVQIKCDVHPWMFAYLAVVDHPWFAVTNAKGEFTLPPGLPPGRYTIAAVHVKAGEAAEEINISDAQTTVVNFTLNAL